MVTINTYILHKQQKTPEKKPKPHPIHYWNYGGGSFRGGWTGCSAYAKENKNQKEKQKQTALVVHPSRAGGSFRDDHHILNRLHRLVKHGLVAQYPFCLLF
jgi:hypothetical protein